MRRAGVAAMAVRFGPCLSLPDKTFPNHTKRPHFPPYEFLFRYAYLGSGSTSRALKKSPEPATRLSSGGPNGDWPATPPASGRKYGRFPRSYGTRKPTHFAQLHVAVGDSNSAPVAHAPAHNPKPILADGCGTTLPQFQGISLRLGRGEITPICLHLAAKGRLLHNSKADGGGT